jgi:lysophospholipase L1-like esterase
MIPKDVLQTVPSKDPRYMETWLDSRFPAGSTLVPVYKNAAGVQFFAVRDAEGRAVEPKDGRAPRMYTAEDFKPTAEDVQMWEKRIAEQKAAARQRAAEYEAMLEEPARQEALRNYQRRNF